MKKLIGNGLLTIGLIGGAISAARIPPMWGGVIGSLAVMGVGIFLRRQGEKEELHKAKQSGTGGKEELERILKTALNDLESLVEARDSLDIKTLRARLDKILEELEKFPEKAQPLRIEGMRAYGEIMTAFSSAERRLNRAWSAYADGYKGEGDTYLELGLESLKNTLKVLHALKL
ncbi:hypothetical protein PAP_04085 [Palaeococcus pacificus DY20341]|uniref:Cell division protein n=1 Tax=Palaeococcus pacificus DY20341 TaxID=1343739 RepID=A0A075LXE8_9EURY|nr:type II toxin-antitoxin system RelE/ParE family toxin [Palaeococcus pacificus]AIF69233.1 hypothetical protein PAP_04085 [Palaeococcus pacificus DY20341]